MYKTQIYIRYPSIEFCTSFQSIFFFWLQARLKNTSLPFKWFKNRMYTWIYKMTTNLMRYISLRCSRNFQSWMNSSTFKLHISYSACQNWLLTQHTEIQQTMQGNWMHKKWNHKLQRITIAINHTSIVIETLHKSMHVLKKWSEV